MSEFLKKCSSVLSETIEHEKYPFAKIASDYGFEPKIMYEYQIGVLSGNNGLKRETLGLEIAKFKLSIHIENEGVAVYYNDALYSEGLMKTLSASINNAAEFMIANEVSNIKAISLLSPAEEKRIQSFGTSASSEIPQKLLHKMFEATAAKNPEKTALIASDKTLTFKELNEEANIIAHNLIQRGLKVRDSAVLLLPRKSFYFAALFGVLKAGAAFIPCDPEYPTERINHITQNSQSAFIITTKEHEADYPPEKILLIDDLLNGIDKGNPDMEVFLRSKDLAYMIYTSDPTEKPKGVILRHVGICNFCTAHPVNILYDTAKNNISAMIDITTVSFDLSLKDTVGMLVNGKTVVFADKNQMNNPKELAILFEQTHADAINGTPSRYVQYMEYEPFIDAIKKCKLIMARGDPFPKSLLEKLQAINTARIINTYGPNETTISTNMADLTHSDIICVGRSLLNVQEYIVDSDGISVPVGVIGELYIGGPGVAKGYCNLDEQTAERFVYFHGIRVYKSGDFAKWEENGNVIILGRKNNQVKLRGLRIELGEVENAIAKVEGVKNVAVKINKIRGIEHLCAYFTADRKIEISDIKTEISRSLMQYMIPTAWLQLDQVPITPNGKTDLKLLPEAVIERARHERAANEAEAAFCKFSVKFLNLMKSKQMKISLNWAELHYQ